MSESKSGSVHEQQVRWWEKARVNLLVNGTNATLGKAVVVPATWQEFRKKASDALQIDAQRFFTAEGHEIMAVEDLLHNDVLVVSTGDDFVTREKAMYTSVRNRIQQQQQAILARLSGLRQSLGDAWEKMVVANFQERVAQPAEKFYHAATQEFASLDKDGDGRVSFADFLSGMKEKLGAAWNDSLLEPAKAFYDSAVNRARSSAGWVSERARAQLGEEWTKTVTDNFNTRVQQPAEYFYGKAMDQYVTVKATGQATLDSFISNLKSNMGDTWTESLTAPAKAFYQTVTQTESQAPADTNAAGAAAATDSTQASSS